MLHLSSLRQRATRVGRRAAVVAASGALAIGAGTFVTAAPAHAWAWDPHVHVAGNATCGPWYSRSQAQLVQMWDDQGHYAQGYTNWLGNYGLDFWSYPSGGGHTVWAKVTCNGPIYYTSYWRSFGLARPAIGTEVGGINFNGP